jgi:hypothetical protein
MENASKSLRYTENTALGVLANKFLCAGSCLLLSVSYVVSVPFRVVTFFTGRVPLGLDIFLNDNIS